MKRRLFLKASAASALVPSALAAPGAAGAAQGDIEAHRFFYDPRFADARAIASIASGDATPVDGDVTQVWTQGLKRLSQKRALALSGVTTESFYFCLKTLLQAEAQIDTRFDRVNTDLYIWSIRTDPKTKTG